MSFTRFASRLLLSFLAGALCSAFPPVAASPANGGGEGCGCTSLDIAFTRASLVLRETDRGP